MKENLNRVSPQEAAGVVRENGKTQTRFVVSLDGAEDPLVIDGTGFYNMHAVLKDEAEIGTAVGGFCTATMEKDLVLNPAQSPNKLPQATAEQFEAAKSRGVVVFK